MRRAPIRSALCNWKRPTAGRFHLPSNHFICTPLVERAQFKFTLTAPPQSATAKIIADAEIDGAHYRNRRVEINYPHIPPHLLQPPASLKAVSLELAIRGHTVGYLPGAGDSVAENLKQMGYAVTILDDANLTPEQLRGLDAVVIGVRAFNVRTNIASELPVLFDLCRERRHRHRSIQPAGRFEDQPAGAI